MATTLSEWMSDVTNTFPVQKTMDYSSPIQTVTTCRGKIEQAIEIIQEANTEISLTFPLLMPDMITECNKQLDIYKQVDAALGVMETALYDAQQVAVVENITGHEINYEPDNCLSEVLILNNAIWQQNELMRSARNALELIEVPNKEV